MAEHKQKKRKIYVNIGMIVFFVMIIYLTGYVMTYLERNKLAIYEVSESDIKDTMEGTGIVIREEELIKTEETGFISPYVKEGSRIRAGGTVYTLDTTGKVQEFIDSFALEKNDTSQEEKLSVIEDLRQFSEGYDDDRFFETYDTKNNVEHDLMAYTDTIMANNKKQFNEKYGKDSYKEIVAEQSGLISYRSDGWEMKTVEDITKEDFSGKNNMKDLRTSAKVNANTPAYRIITSQKWHVVMELSQDEYMKMKKLENEEKTNVNVGFDKDDFVAPATFSCYMKDNYCFIDLAFDKYVHRYINQRYLWVRVIIAEADGLIVPTSSIVFKGAYKIPAEYLVTDEKKHYFVNVVDEGISGKQSLHQVEVDIVKSKDDYYYVNGSGLSDGDIITNENEDTTMVLKKKAKVRGVYVVNQGYASFQTVELKERTEDYCILYVRGSNIQMYDRIILHSDSIKENQLIY